MNNIPRRDIDGHCEGECRNRVFESEQNQQKRINESQLDYSTPVSSPSWASDRNSSPGFLGGHV